MSIAIKPVRFTENGFMTQPFALGGEGAEGLDPAVKYRSCLQNWVVDTGSEVILVDTGVPEDFPFGAPTPDATIYVGSKIKSYLEALADLGYRPEQGNTIATVLIGVKDAEGSSYQRRLCVAVSSNSTVPTSVRSIAAGTEDHAASYNLAGQRVDTSYQGIVVVKGKKGYKRSK